MLFRIAWIVFALVISRTVFAEEGQSIRVGLLRFGTVAWEIDTLRYAGLNRKYGIALDTIELASNEAAKVALQAGAVDMIVTDWPWVARQRSEGALLSFIPYSKAVGVLVIPQGSKVVSLADLKGSRIGVAGGPFDKSWLLLRAYARKELAMDLGGGASEPVFGAPPLLSEEFARGRIDAVLTYWHYAARLEAAGARPFLTVVDMMRHLGVDEDVPMLGYAFRDEWAQHHKAALEAFVAASREAKMLLAGSSEAWARLRPEIGTDDPVVLASLQAGYRAGIPEHWGAAERKACADLYAILASIGGETLVGKAKVLDPETFWPFIFY